MANKWVTVLAGFLLVFGCVIGIMVILFQEEAGKESANLEKSIEGFMNREPQNVIKQKEDAPLLSHTRRNSEEINPQLANELEKLFTKNHIRTLTGSPILVKKNFTRNGTRAANLNLPTKIADELERNAPKLINHADLVSRTHQRFNSSQTSQQISKANIPLRIDDKFRVGPHLSRSILPTPGLEPIVVPNKIHASQNQSGNDDDTGKLGSLQTSMSSMNEEWEDSDIPHEDDDVYEEDQYISETGSQEEGDSAQLDELFDLASNLYSKGVNVSDFHGFLKNDMWMDYSQKLSTTLLIRETESSLLSQLNEVYTRPGILPSSIGSEVGVVGRNAYESSITAFLFMSFGIFLLNQIHSLMIGKESSGAEEKQSRHISMNSLEPSDLNVLFEPPEPDWALANEKTFANNKNSNSGNTTAFFESNMNGSIASSSSYMNNMFRALVNLVNAYTKNSQDLECIWSLYCHDLDKTSAQEGVYGIAARINSIGLRLIMHQISAELTMDVMLRSLLSWDGLPCQKMFPQCQFNNATKTLKAASVPNSDSVHILK